MSSYVSEFAKKKTGGLLSPVSENDDEKKLKSSQSITLDNTNNTNNTTNTNTNNKNNSPNNSNNTNPSSVDLGVGWETFTTENRTIRNGFLEYVQSHSLGANLTRRSRRGSVNNSIYKKNSNNNSRPKTASFLTFSYPAYIQRNIVVPAPSDMVTIEVSLLLIFLIIYLLLFIYHYLSLLLIIYLFYLNK